MSDYYHCVVFPHSETLWTLLVLGPTYKPVEWAQFLGTWPSRIN